MFAAPNMFLTLPPGVFGGAVCCSAAELEPCMLRYAFFVCRGEGKGGRARQEEAVGGCDQRVLAVHHRVLGLDWGAPEGMPQCGGVHLAVY